MQLELITKEVATETTGWSGGNVGGIVLENCLVAIDTAHNNSKGREFRIALEKEFGMPVGFTFLTHHHSDHAKGLDAFSDTTIISSEITAKKIRSLKSITTYPTVVFKNDYIIKDGQRQIQLNRTGGHTIDSSYLYDSKEQVLFSGDLIFEGYLLFAGYKSNPLEWIDVLTRFKRLRPLFIIPGHGPIIRNIKELEKHIYVIQSIVDCIGSMEADHLNLGDLTIPQRVKQVYNKAPADELTKWFYRTITSWRKRV